MVSRKTTNIHHTQTQKPKQTNTRKEEPPKKNNKMQVLTRYQRYCFDTSRRLRGVVQGGVQGGIVKRVVKETNSLKQTSSFNRHQTLKRNRKDTKAFVQNKVQKLSYNHSYHRRLDDNSIQNQTVALIDDCQTEMMTSQETIQNNENENENGISQQFKTTRTHKKERKPKAGQSLADKFPEIAAQWHPSRNGDLRSCDVGTSSTREVWWLCPNSCEGEKDCVHEWKAPVKRRTRKKSCGCPKFGCSHAPKGRPCCTARSLASPEFDSLSFHETKNGSVGRRDLYSGSGISVWWSCPNTCQGEDDCVHEWKVSVKNRTRKRNPSGCPRTGCSKSAPKGIPCCRSNSLAADEYGYLQSQFHVEMNVGITPRDIYVGSKTKRWWQCRNRSKNNILGNFSKGCMHIWEAQPKMRVSQSTDCPRCNMSKMEIAMMKAIEEVRTQPSVSPHAPLEWKPSTTTRRTTIIATKTTIAKKTPWVISGWEHEVSLDGSSKRGDKRELRADFVITIEITSPQVVTEGDIDGGDDDDDDIKSNITRMVLVVETDGQQHFRPVYFGGGRRSPSDLQDDLESIRARDADKNAWCTDASRSEFTRLLRVGYKVPHTDYPSILRRCISKMVKSRTRVKGGDDDDDGRRNTDQHRDRDLITFVGENYVKKKMKHDN